MSHRTDDPNSMLNRIDDPTFIKTFSDHAGASQSGILGTVGSGRPLATFVHDYHLPPTTEMEDALRFYDDNYESIAQYFLSPTERKYLGDKGRRHCRFCGRSKPEATFRNVAHAIPESLGNRTLISYYECDECNKLFGESIENDFGNWSRPMRTMARVRSKKGYPAMRLGPDGIWKVVATSGTNLDVVGDDPAFTVDEANNEIHMRLPRGNHVPLAVVKALVKMGLTILPEGEMVNFQQAIAWIREKTHVQGIYPTHSITETFVPGPLPNTFITLMVWRRKHDDLAVPYATFMLTYANEMLQIFLPSPERDSQNAGKQVQVFRFPHLSEYKGNQHGESTTDVIDMSGTSVVRGEIVEATMSFEAIIERTEPMKDLLPA